MARELELGHGKSIYTTEIGKLQIRAFVGDGGRGVSFDMVTHSPLSTCWYKDCSVADTIFPRESRLSSKDTDAAIEMAGG